MNTLTGNLKLFTLLMDIGMFRFRTTTQKALYLVAALRDAGMNLTDEAIVEVFNATELDNTKYFSLTQSVHVINPDDETSLYHILGKDYFTISTLGALLSTVFPRHETRIRKNGDVDSYYVNGVVYH